VETWKTDVLTETHETDVLSRTVKTDVLNAGIIPDEEYRKGTAFLNEPEELVQRTKKITTFEITRSIVNTHTDEVIE